MTAAQEKLINDNYALAPYCVKKFSRKFYSIDHEDMLSLAHLGLVDAARTFDPSKGAFSTYVISTIRLRLISEMTTQSYAKRTGINVSLDEWKDFGSATDTETAIDVRKTLERAMMGAHKQARECFVLRYIHGYKYDEIGEMFGFSGQNARIRAEQVAKRFRMFWELSHRGEAV